jgi:hypothetical protein
MRELTLMTRLGHATPDSMKVYTRVSDPEVVPAGPPRRPRGDLSCAASKRNAPGVLHRHHQALAVLLAIGACWESAGIKVDAHRQRIGARRR